LALILFESPIEDVPATVADRKGLSVALKEVEGELVDNRFIRDILRE
jgi:hypothetical protein